LPQVLKELDSGEAYKLAGVSIAIAMAMVLTRILWIFPSAYLPHWIDGRLGRAKLSYPPWRHILFAGWAGIRGGDSLVIALALPYAGTHGVPLAGRAAVIFITFGVILVTLVAQGFTLAPLIRALGIAGGYQRG
jgi:NhaP-type Na+/H+ or K+/H+ antiporter